MLCNYSFAFHKLLVIIIFIIVDFSNVTVSITILKKSFEENLRYFILNEFDQNFKTYTFMLVRDKNNLFRNLIGSYTIIF